MQSMIINVGKNVFNNMATLLARGLDTGLVGNLTRSLQASYQKSFTRQFLVHNLVRKSYAYSLLLAFTGAIERYLELPAWNKIRRLLSMMPGVLFILAILTTLTFFFLPWKPAITAIGVILLAAGVFYRTETGLYAAALLLPFVPFKALLGLAVLTLVSFICKRFRFHLSPLLIPLLLFYLVMFYATVTSVSFWDSASELLIPVTGLIYLLVIISLFDSRVKLDNFIFCLAIAGVITAGYAVYQYYTGANAVELKKEWVDLTSNPEIRNRAYAVFENPNLLAQYLILMATLALAAVFNAVRLWQRIFFASAAALAAFCLVLTYSRGGWLAFGAALAVFALFKSRILIQVLAAAGIIVYSVMPPAVMHRLSTITSLKDTSNAYRLDTWHSTLSLIKAHWETGVGLGRKAFARVYYTHMINSNVVPHSHNLYLQIISEFGILGLAVFCWLFLGIFQLGLKLRATGNNFIKNLNAGIMGALAGFLTHSVVDYFLWYYKLGILLWLLVAIVLVLEKLAEQQNNQERNVQNE